jgi:hypothetical protein
MKPLNRDHARIAIGIGLIILMAILLAGCFGFSGNAPQPQYPNNNGICNVNGRGAVTGVITPAILTCGAPSG